MYLNATSTWEVNVNEGFFTPLKILSLNIIKLKKNDLKFDQLTAIAQFKNQVPNAANSDIDTKQHSK